MRLRMKSQITDSMDDILLTEHRFGVDEQERRENMKGYAVESGYMGYVNGEYMLFASESDYEDYMAA